MSKFKLCTSFLIVVVLNAFVFSSSAQAGTNSSKRAEKVRSAIAKLGTGTQAKIKVKLTDGTKLKGYVSEINAESFSVTNDKTGTVTEVNYGNAKQVKGNNLSTGVKIAIGLGILLGIIIAVALLSDDIT